MQEPEQKPLLSIVTARASLKDGSLSTLNHIPMILRNGKKIERNEKYFRKSAVEGSQQTVYRMYTGRQFPNVKNLKTHTLLFFIQL